MLKFLTCIKTEKYINTDIGIRFDVVASNTNGFTVEDGFLHMFGMKNIATR